MMFSRTFVAKVASALFLSAAAGLVSADPINAGSSIAVPSLGIPLSGVVSGTLDQVYIFNLASDAGGLVAKYNRDSAGPSVFEGAFYRWNDADVLIGMKLGEFYQSDSKTLEFSYGALTAGYYAFRFTDDGGVGVEYSGEFSTYVPAPGVLALLGIGLLGMVATRRKSQ